MNTKAFGSTFTHGDHNSGIDSHFMRQEQISWEGGAIEIITKFRISIWATRLPPYSPEFDIIPCGIRHPNPSLKRISTVFAVDRLGSRTPTNGNISFRRPEIWLRWCSQCNCRLPRACILSNNFFVCAKIIFPRFVLSPPQISNFARSRPRCGRQEQSFDPCTNRANTTADSIDATNLKYFLQEGVDLAKHHQSFDFFRRIRQFCPKQPFKHSHIWWSRSTHESIPGIGWINSILLWHSISWPRLPFPNVVGVSGFIIRWNWCFFTIEWMFGGTSQSASHYVENIVHWIHQTDFWSFGPLLEWPSPKSLKHGWQVDCISFPNRVSPIRSRKLFD